MLMDNKNDIFNFISAIVKVYLMTFFVRVMLWVAQNVIRLKTDIKALESRMKNLKVSTKLSREARLNPGASFVQNGIKLLVNETEAIYNEFEQYVDTCNKISIAEVVDSFGVEEDQVKAYFAGEALTLNGELDPSLRNMLQLTSQICPVVDGLEQDVAEFIKSALLNYAVPSVELDATSFEKLYEEKKNQFANMSAGRTGSYATLPDPGLVVRSETSLLDATGAVSYTHLTLPTILLV